MRAAAIILLIATIALGFARRWVFFILCLILTVVVGFFAIVGRF